MAQTPGAQSSIIFPTPNPIVDRREVSRTNLLAQAVHFLRLADARSRIQRLKEILNLTDKDAVLSELESLGLKVDADLAVQDLPTLLEAIAGLIREIERKSQIPTLTEDFSRQLTAVQSMEGGPRSSDVLPTDPRLKHLRADFDRGLFILEEKKVVPQPGERPADALKRKQPDRSKLTWEDVVEHLNRLNPKNHEKTNLALVLAMEGGGELIGVSKGGQLLFKDRGEEPTYCRGMNYWETYETVYGPEGQPTGYELFPTEEAFKKPKSVTVLEYIRKLPFFKGVEGTSTWLNNGRDPQKKLATVRTLDYSNISGQTSVLPNLPSEKRPTRGAVRLLKV